MSPLEGIFIYFWVFGVLCGIGFVFLVREAFK